MKLLLINPSNPIVSMSSDKSSRWTKYRVWKPLSLMVIAALTPKDWEITILDENVGIPDYDALPRPDLVGITSFTSQASRAYELADDFRSRGIPVVMGGIHATMCQDEAMEHADAVVTGEAEGVWPELLEDAKQGKMKRVYDGSLIDMEHVPAARHDLMSDAYALGVIQTTRGCPLNCSFCSVTRFNGTRYRQRPIPDVVEEFRSIREKRVLIVDDNIIGTRREHIARAKDLFRAMADADLGKKWIAQTTINFADDEELLTLAKKAGCTGVFIGLETTTPEGLVEIGKKFNLAHDRNIRDSVRRIQRHKILVLGSFILGLDVHEPGVGREIAQSATDYGIDILHVLYLTPLPGTRLWEQMSADDRIPLATFPDDWKYYTLTRPVAEYQNFTYDEIVDEMIDCNRTFYSVSRVLRRVGASLLNRRQPFISLVSNFSYRRNNKLDRKTYEGFFDRMEAAADQASVASQDRATELRALAGTGDD